MALVPLRGLYITANLQGNPAHRRARRPAEPRSKPTSTPATSTVPMSIPSVSAPARLSPCCRRKTPPATGSKSCSAYRSRSCSTSPSRPISRCGWAFRSRPLSTSPTRAGRCSLPRSSTNYGEHGTIPETMRRMKPPDDGTQKYHVFPPSEQAPATSQPNPAPTGFHAMRIPTRRARRRPARRRSSYPETPRFLRDGRGRSR